jgi:hypothetical protein
MEMPWAFISGNRGIIETSLSTPMPKAPKPKIKNFEVAYVFGGYPADMQAKLFFLRELIFEVAAETPDVGPLEEVLKWGQPSYLTTQTKSGSLIRIDQLKKEPGRYAMFFHCQTNLVETFRSLYADLFAYGGQRSIIFQVEKHVPVEELRQCIKLALTYHLRKRQLRNE